jgi:hypothetical protein
VKGAVREREESDDGNDEKRFLPFSSVCEPVGRRDGTNRLATNRFKIKRRKERRETCIEDTKTMEEKASRG